MARQNGKELSYPLNRQGQVCVGVYGRCCGSIVAKKVLLKGVAPRVFIWTWRGLDSSTRNEKSFNRSTCYYVLAPAEFSEWPVEVIGTSPVLMSR